MADTTSLPFNPLRTTLYSMPELFAGFSESDAASYGACRDVKILRYFVANGKHPTRHPAAITLEALHDNSIAEAAQRLLARRTRVAAIMGGHVMARGTPGYTDVAHAAYELTRAGFLVASGGGPGAMEATHLGAVLSRHPRRDLDAALAELRAAPTLPAGAAGLVGRGGRVDRAVAVALHRWLAPAFRLASAIFADRSFDPGDSLAVPTWLYGYEPTTPFATHIAKYFQNSVREDGLVTLARDGIVYAEGSAGTVQEIFQDVVQNAYGEFCPMVFLSSPRRRFWSRTLPAEPLVRALLGHRPEYAERVLFTDSAAAAVEFLVARTRRRPVRPPDTARRLRPR